MRLLEIPNMEYEKYRAFLDSILEKIPFALLNSEFSKKLGKGFFYFWDLSYIPENLRQFALFPPKTHENVEELHKALEEIMK